MTITIEQLKAIMPNCGSRGQLFLPHLNAAIDKFEIENVSAFLAQVCVESGSLLYVEEIASGTQYNERSDLGNTRSEAIAAAAVVGLKPGVFYKGHGLIQITGFDNHKACGEDLDLDLVSNPRLLTQPNYAALSAAWFWDKHGLDDVEDFEVITKRINGGLNGYTQRLVAYKRAQDALA